MKKNAGERSREEKREREHRGMEAGSKGIGIQGGGCEERKKG